MCSRLRIAIGLILYLSVPEPKAIRKSENQKAEWSDDCLLTVYSVKGKRIITTSQICRIHISRGVYSTKEQAEEGAEDVYFKVVWDGTELSAETPVSVFGEQGEWQVEQYFKPPPMKSGIEYEVKAWTRNSENETDD